ncbi:TonB-dependent receptor [Aromatoleum toluvorans]|uniref:TonB-dependent receptor n=1 Tax=Aromatoleum toluvorans TaxID=92002 RepID=A0ABX1Q482_9RHOO|nr:TonB-dependent receptor [Aromatoleum toluvorans]NMG45305.1 TonB-dependent receptor [Aromatoleum toluvorans]
MRLKPLARLIPAALLFACAAVHAEETQLEAVTVTATRSGGVAGETPQKITVITREEIEHQLAINSEPSQVLGNLIPSYSPSRQKLSNAGETFRGRNALYMIDGVPQSNPLRDGKREGYTVDLSMVERIEIIHGASAEQGLGATGGIINFVTRRPRGGDLRQHAGVSVTAPTENDYDGLGYKLDYRVEGSRGNWDFLAGLSYQTRGLYYDADGKAIGVDNTQGDTMDSKSYDALFKLGYWFDDNQNLTLSINRFELKGNNDYVNVPGDASEGIPATSRRGTVGGDAPKNEALTSSLSYTHAKLAGNEIGVQLYSQRFRALFGGGTETAFQDPRIAPRGTLFDQSQNESEKLGAKFTVKRDGLLDNRLMLTGGFDVLQDKTRQRLVDTDRDWVPETRFRNFAPFVQAELRPFQRLKLQGGVRREFAELDVDTFQTVWSTNRAGGVTVQGGNPTFEETLYNAGFVFEATDWAQVFANYSEGFGMPDVGRVLRAISTAGQSVNNFLDLQPIVTDNREAGFRLKRGPFDFELSYFESDSDLGSRLVSVGGVYQVRREKTEINGIEASAGWKINADHRLQASYAQVNGRSDTDGDGKVDTDLDGANISPDRLTLRWSARWSDKIDSHVQGSYFFDRRFDDRRLDFSGYSLVDASMTYRLPVGRLTAGVENLFNKDYVTYYSQTLAANEATRDERYFKGRGRTVTVGYQVDF